MHGRTDMMLRQLKIIENSTFIEMLKLTDVTIVDMIFTKKGG